MIVLGSSVPSLRSIWLLMSIMAGASRPAFLRAVISSKPPGLCLIAKAFGKWTVTLVGDLMVTSCDFGVATAAREWARIISRKRRRRLGLVGRLTKEADGHRVMPDLAVVRLQPADDGVRDVQDSEHDQTGDADDQEYQE